MDDILSAIIGIALASIIMFIFPLITMSDRADDISQLTVKIATTEFANNVKKVGKITPNDYNVFIQNIGSTGNTYNVEMEVRVLDENPSRKVVQAPPDTTPPTENIYYSVYTSQIQEVLERDEGNEYLLKEGDIFTVNVKNTNQTMSQQLKNFFYKVIGKDTYIIAATGTGLVTTTGKY